MKDIYINLIAAFIYTVLVLIAGRIWSVYGWQFRNEYSKITYYRIIRLRFRDENDAPYYIRRHHTIEGESTEVFDETWVLNGVQCTKPSKLEPVRITSSGTVDAFQILPVLTRDADPHPHTRDNSKMFMFSHSDPCTQLVAVGTLINGIQSQSDWWYGTTAQYNGQTLLLILDFTSLPYEHCPIRNVTPILERDHQVVEKESVSQQWFEERKGPDLYYLRFRKAKKGDIIKFKFEIDKNAIPRIKCEGVPRPSISQAFLSRKLSEGAGTGCMSKDISVNVDSRG